MHLVIREFSHLQWSTHSQESCLGDSANYHLHPYEYRPHYPEASKANFAILQLDEATQLVNLVRILDLARARLRSGLLLLLLLQDLELML